MALASENRAFKGLIPILDRKRSEEPFVVDGKNFFVDLNGPVSGLGRTWVYHQLIDAPRGWQTLRDGDANDVFHFVGDAICRYDVDSRQLYPVFGHVQRIEFWPWTRAVVGSIAYYCNKEVGIIKHDYVGGQWENITGQTGMPTTPIACCESAGRLIVLGETAVVWSTVDDGTDTTTSTSTGAGFQLLSLLSSASLPMMVLPYEHGFLTYTRAGIMRSEQVDAANPFRHRPFSRDHKILNPWAVQRIGGPDREQHILLTERGFFTTFGDSPLEAWHPLMSEFFHRNLIPNISTDLRTNMTFRIENNFKTGWIIISVSEDSRSAFYTRAYILYVPSQEWGVYSRVHHGFGELFLNSGPDTGFRYSVVDVEGSNWRFSFADSEREYPVADKPNYRVDYRQPVEMPVRNFAGIANSTPAIMSTMMTLTAFDLSKITDPSVYDLESFQLRKLSPSVMPDITADETPVEADPPTSGVNKMRVAMQMQVGMQQVAVKPMAFVNAPLLSEILVGPYRFQEETSIDQITQLTETVVGMLDVGFLDTFEDYLEDYLDDEVEEDWNALSGEEDWGEAAGDQTEYIASWIGTLDGYVTWIVNGVTQDVTPSIVDQTGRNRHLAGSCSGTYVFMKYTANNVGEAFHLRTLKYNMINAGQLF